MSSVNPPVGFLKVASSVASAALTAEVPQHVVHGAEGEKGLVVMVALDKHAEVVEVCLSAFIAG